MLVPKRSPSLHIECFLKCSKPSTLQDHRCRESPAHVTKTKFRHLAMFNMYRSLWPNTTWPFILDGFVMDSPPAKKQSSFTQNTGLHWAKTLAVNPLSNTKSAGNKLQESSFIIHHVVRKFSQPLSVHDPSIHLSTYNTNMIDFKPVVRNFLLHLQINAWSIASLWQMEVSPLLIPMSPPHLQHFVERRLSSCKTGVEDVGSAVPQGFSYQDPENASWDCSSSARGGLSSVICMFF